MATSTTIVSGWVRKLYGSASGATVSSFAAGGRLEIDGAGIPTATISGFRTGQTIDLTGLALSAAR